MRSLLIADQSQFGYHITPYKYARLLQHHCAVTYVCWDYGLQRPDSQATTVAYVSRQGGKLARLGRYIRTVLREVRTGKYDVVLVLQFPFCFLLPLLSPGQLMVLEVVTGYVRDSAIVKRISDTMVLVDSWIFHHVAILSESLREDLHIGRKKSQIIPLGADEVQTPRKNFTSMRLLYVGTLEFRHIDKSVLGFEQFYREYRDHIALSYDIVGSGSPEDDAHLRKTIERSFCRDVVRFHGWVPHDQLLPFLQNNNIGIAFIPIIRKFDCQPATKIFEYLLAGMPVLATATGENALVVQESNGVLIEDTAEGVYEGLKTMYGRLTWYDSEAIKSKSVKYSWDNVILGILKPYLEGLVDRHNTHQRRVGETLYVESGNGVNEIA